MKPRIIGAMVLTALAVIILPMLLDFDRNYTVDTQTQIPQRPDITPVQIAMPEPVAGNENSPAAEQIFRLDAVDEMAGRNESSAADGAGKGDGTGNGGGSKKNEGSKKENGNKNENNADDSKLGEVLPGLTEEGVPVSWILQVASFSDLDKAKSLTEKLQKDQYSAFLKPASAEGKVTYRVFVGPKILKQDMLDEKSSIERKYKIETLVRRFEP